MFCSRPGTAQHDQDIASGGEPVFLLILNS
jgi:hypothetical protein